MDVDWEVRVFFMDGVDEKCGGMRFEDISYIFDIKNVNVESNEFVNEIKVVRKVIFFVRCLYELLVMKIIRGEKLFISMLLE